jgi:ketosteroid isomerase-like protein
MSQENVEIVRAMVAAAETGDWDTALEGFDPEVELDQRRMPDGGIYKTPGGVRKFYERWLGSWDQLRVESKGVIAAPDGRVISLLRISGRGRGSGIDVAMEAADVFTLRDGKVIRMVGFPDRAEALEAVGLSEQDAHSDS